MRITRKAQAVTSPWSLGMQWQAAQLQTSLGLGVSCGHPLLCGSRFAFMDVLARPHQLACIHCARNVR